MTINGTPKTALITGITGSGGSYLAEHIVNNHPLVQVSGISRWHSTTNEDNLSHIASQVKVYEADLVDLSSIIRVLDEVKPDVVFHLAAYANVRASFITASSVLTNNIVGTTNLFEAIRLLNLDPLIQLCSTSEVYGQVEERHVPITENAPLKPASPYAVSKTAQDMLGWTYFVSYGMRIIRTRMFSYINPKRSDLFASSFARQVARIEKGLQKELLHGNLDSIRTLIDVRDAMRAYWDAILYCQPGECYNIGGQTSMSVGKFLDRLIALSEVPIQTRIDPSLLRPADVTLQIPNVDKFTSKTNWQPIYSFDDSMEFLLNHWRLEAEKSVLKQS